MVETERIKLEERSNNMALLAEQVLGHIATNSPSRKELGRAYRDQDVPLIQLIGRITGTDELQTVVKRDPAADNRYRILTDLAVIETERNSFGITDANSILQSSLNGLPEGQTHGPKHKDAKFRTIAES